jgi:hypothetical protein
VTSSYEIPVRFQLTLQRYTVEHSFMKAAVIISIQRIVPSGMLRRVALVRTDVSEELSSSFIRVTGIGKLGTTLAVTSNRRTLRRYTKAFLRSVRRLLVTASVVLNSPIPVTLMKEALSSSETSVLTRATRRNFTEDTVLYSHRRKNLKSYTSIQGWSFTLKT